MRANVCERTGSGDGTLRKNPMIWRKWSPSFGLGLHRYQAVLTRESCAKTPAYLTTTIGPPWL